MNRLDKVAYKRIFCDWKMYVAILMYFGIVNNGYATSVNVGKPPYLNTIADSAKVLHAHNYRRDGRRPAQSPSAKYPNLQ